MKLTTVGVSKRFTAGVAALCAAVLLLGAYVGAQGALTAKAGPDQQGMYVGDTVHLDGTASIGATSYAWTFTKRPSGSTATLTNPLTATPTFVPDRGGLYTVKLTVGNGVTTSSDTVNITPANRPPVANAGPDISSALAKSVTLDGTGSSDPDLNKLTYQWTLVSQPPASVSALAKATTSKATLFLDRPGTYVAQLVVKDGLVFSAPDQVTITTTNVAPVADAGPDRLVPVGGVVQLNGTASSDADENTLTYLWTLKRPKGSTAVLDDPASPLPSFVPNVAGTYTATLNVNDGTVTVKDTVVITTNTNRNPVARTEADDVALANGETIQLDASDSTDTNGGLLAYAWTVTKRPGGSNAPLVGAATPRPTFTADKAGSYTFSLAVTDPSALAATDTQLIGTPLPQANAGPDQVVTLGAQVTLEGSPSSHLGDTAVLGYGWALISRPAGSLAEIDDPIDPQPHFVADLAGTYIAQLIVFDGTRLSKADTVTISTNGNLPPRVDLGPDRHTTVGGLVTVDALATDPNLDPLAFAWTLLSRPAGSAATLSGASGTPVHLTPDVAGDYIVQLAATDPGGLSAVDTLLITTGNTTPTVTGPGDAAVASGVPVPLSAAASDPDGGAITYAWSLLARPTGSASAISSPSAAAPTFTPDEDGVYVVQLLVRDTRKLYAVDATVFRVGGAANAPPIADAGSPQTVAPGALVHLDGSGSSDPESQPLTYAWSFVSKPAGSGAAFNSPTASNPTFTADLGGDYVVRLIVNDGTQDSDPSDVTITTNAAPTAHAGPDQGGVDLGVPVNLTGSASTDPESDPLTYLWTFVSKPAGSTAVLSSATSATPTFTPDLDGTYVVQLVVNDGFTSSAADDVIITTRRPLSLSPSSVSTSSGATTLLTLTAAYAAPTNLVVTLTSSNTGVATVPASVTILANQTTATFNLTGGASTGGAMITASGGVGVGSANVTVANGVRLAQWAVDASGAWETPSNWTDNAIPGAGDVVIIDRPAGNFVVTLGSSTPALASLLSRETLAINGTLTVNGGMAFEGPVTLAGSLNGIGAATLNAAMTWTSGTVGIGGGLTVLPGQTMTLVSNTGTHWLIGSSLTNHGTVVMGTNSHLGMQTPASATNAADGLWTIDVGSQIVTNGAGALTFANAGTFRKIGSGAGHFSGFVAATNTGTIDVQAGTMQMNDSTSLLNSGGITLGAGTTFLLDKVTLATGTAFSGAGTIDMNGTTTVTGNVTIPVTTQIHSILTGAGTVHMAAPLTWVAGTVSLGAGLEVLTGQTMTLVSNTGTHWLIGSSLTNHGTVVMGTNSHLGMQAPASVTNANDGLWTVDVNSQITTNGGGALTFANAGVFRKIGSGPGYFTGFVAVTNTGTMDVQAGTMQMNDSTSLLNSSSIALGSGTTFLLDKVTLAAGTAFSGAGTIDMNGTTTVTGNVTIPVTTEIHSILTGAGTVHMAAPLTWVAGTVSLGGGLEVLTGQTMTLVSNTGTHWLIGSSLTNHGTVVMGTNSHLGMQAPASVTNANDGLWTVDVNSQITTNGGGALTFANAGVFRKIGSGPGYFTGFVAVTNTGTMDVQAGTLQMNDSTSLLNSSSIALGSDTTFLLDKVTLAAGTAFSGAGTIDMNGTTTVTGNVTIPVTTQIHSILTGAGTVHMAAPLTWVAGTITNGGGLEVLAGQTMTLTSNTGTHWLIGSSIVNHGTVVIGTNSHLGMQAPASVTNANDGLWTIDVNSQITTNGGGALTFVNTGVFRKIGSGPGYFSGFVAATSTGTIDVQAGTLQLNDSTSLLNSGALTLAADTTFYVDKATLNSGTTASGGGTLNMNGTTTINAVLTSATPVTLANTLTGSGTLKMAAPMTWTAGSLSLTGGLEILAGQSLALSGALNLFSGTSVKNFGTVSWGSGSFTYNGGSIAIRNEVGGVWNLTAGGFTLAGNGNPNPLGSFTFLNAGTMQGAGNPATTLTVAINVSFSNTGTVNNMLVN